MLSYSNPEGSSKVLSYQMLFRLRRKCRRYNKNLSTQESAKTLPLNKKQERGNLPDRCVIQLTRVAAHSVCKTPGDIQVRFKSHLKLQAFILKCKSKLGHNIHKNRQPPGIGSTFSEELSILSSTVFSD